MAEDMSERDNKKVQEHLGLLSQMENERTNKEDVWQKLADYVMPHLEDIEQTNEPDEQYGLRMFDGTAPRAHEIATYGTYSNLISKSNQWFQPRAQMSDLNDIPEVSAYLQDVGEQLYFALDRSNFYKEALPFVNDGIGMGTATMLIDDDKGVAVCDTIHPAQIFIGQDKNKEVDVIYRKYKVEIRNVAARFGMEKLSEQQRKQLEHAPFSMMEMLYIIAYRQEYDPFKFDNKNMPVASIYIDIAERKIMGESGYNSFPAANWRYFINSGEVYGRAPGELILPMIEGANQMQEDMLYVSETSAMPPVQAPADMRGKEL
jgi:hypothetical protein